MDVYEAVSSRRSIREYLPTPVPEATIRRVLSTAARAPSGGNLQPWHIDVVTGDALARLKRLMGERLARTVEIDKPQEYDVYPKPLSEPYRDRRFKVGEEMYTLVGIAREDREARLRWFAHNYEFFGAPMGLFCSVHQQMGPPQWSDLGMFLQSVMLLLREEGLDSCPQEAWALYYRTIRDFLGLPPEHMLFMGMAIGYRKPDSAVNSLVASRAPLEEFVRFHGF